MTKAIDKTNRELKMKYKREHKYKVEMYEEQLYKEVVYDTRSNATEAEEYKFMNPLKKSRKGGTRIRNINQEAKDAQERAHVPAHTRRPVLVQNAQQAAEDRIYDPYDYFRTGFPEEEEGIFCTKEQNFQQLMLIKYDYLTKQLWRELDFYQTQPRVIPIKIDQHVYYRRIDNPADSLTVYRFPVDELPKWQANQVGFIGEELQPQQASAFSGEVPSYPSDPELNDHLDYTQIEAAKAFNKTFPEEEIFSLRDLTAFYEKYARHDERIKAFVEKITEFVRLQNHQPLHSFQINELIDTEYGTARIAVLIFDTEENGQSFDILVKDLEQDVLLPVLILNTDGEVAFDKMAGFYYT